jgi:hypothetical protein
MISRLIAGLGYGGVELVFNKLLSILAGASLAIAAPAVAQSGPPVKLSRNFICHPKGGTYYSRTSNFTAFQTMAACIKAGGRPPLR